MSAKRAVSAVAVTSEVAQALAGPGQHLGDMVWLSLSGVDMRRDSVRAAYRAEGMPESLAPSDPSDEGAFGMAISAFGSRDEHGMFLRRVAANKKGGDVLLLRVKDNGGALHDVDTLARVGLASAGNIQVTGSALYDHRAKKVVERLEALYQQRRECCTSAEIGSSVVEVLCRWCGGLRMRERGNVYWAHAAGASEVRALARAVATFGQSYLAVFPVHDNAEARSTLQRAAAESFFGELREIGEELARFKEHAGLRGSTLERRIDQYEELRDRVDLYADVLAGKRDELIAQLDAAKAAVRAMLAGPEAIS